MSEQRSDPDAASALAASGIASELRVVLGQIKRRLREEVHLGDLSWSQAQVLARLEREGPATVTNLARAEGVRPQSMGETLSTLKTAGLVSGAPDPSDGRQTVLSITGACRELLETARAARDDWLLRAIRTKLAPGEQADLARTVELLKRLIEP